MIAYIMRNKFHLAATKNCKWNVFELDKSYGSGNRILEYTKSHNKVFVYLFFFQLFKLEESHDDHFITMPPS